MTWLNILLTWIAVSVCTLGAYAILVYLFKYKNEMNRGPFGQIYREPIDNHSIIVGCDPAEGCGNEKEPLPFIIGREPTFIRYDRLVAIEENEYRKNQYVHLRHLIESGQISLAPHLCLSCADPIAPDEQPYCTQCFERLEREGFFEEYYHE